MKKAIFAAAAVFFGFVFLSCSDVFGGRETEGITFTVPPVSAAKRFVPCEGGSRRRGRTVVDLCLFVR